MEKFSSSPSWLSTAPVAAEELVLNGVVVVHCWASWNIYDREMSRLIGILQPEFEGQILFRSCDVDVESNRQFVIDVANVPAIECFIRGQLFETLVGLRPADILRSKFVDWLRV